ncbi:MAG: hypothetical protein HYZ13_11205 [Acidobacteria bacterium]|nr:hypothetical protein [Acidobacteriota bacterium]
MLKPLWILPLGLGFALTFPQGGSTSTFPTHVRPLLQSKCMPCHFEGGTMYAKLPFDRPAPVRALGEKLFTRLKDPAEQKVIQTFLAEPPEAEPKP